MITEIWDIDDDCLEYSDISDDEKKAGIKIITLRKDDLLCWLYDPDLFSRTAYKAKDHRKVKAILGEWEQGKALTPPLLREAPNGKLLVFDGKHRLGVSMLEGSSANITIAMTGNSNNLTKYSTQTVREYK